MTTQTGIPHFLAGLWFLNRFLRLLIPGEIVPYRDWFREFIGIPVRINLVNERQEQQGFTVRLPFSESFKTSVSFSCDIENKE